MLYASVEEAHQHEGAALVAPRAADYRETTGQLHGSIG